jgi:hypothetical protein
VIAAPPAASLSVSPSRVVLVAAQTQQLTVTNRSARPVVVDAARAGFALGLRGRARILVHGAPLDVRPRRVVVPAHGAARLGVSSALAGGAAPGDHPGLVLLTTRPTTAAVGVRLRLGVVVLVRVPGRIVHRLVGQRLGRSRGRLELWVRNGGNVAEDCAQLRILPAFHAAARTLLPHARGVCDLGRVPRRHGMLVVRLLSRTFRLRL